MFCSCLLRSQEANVLSSSVYIKKCLYATADAAAKSKKKKGRKAMEEAMHVVKQSMSDTGGLGYFHVSPGALLLSSLADCMLSVNSSALLLSSLAESVLSVSSCAPVPSGQSDSVLSVHSCAPLLSNITLRCPIFQAVLK